ncbi:heavy metal-associated domain-containing protein [Porphyromonadaceae bacterium W3.11]|nr:heavy metal-associated domain-containing protein [Porphyromonadaceae bacterium W3.11]
MTEKKFTVNGMKCAGCVSAVEMGLKNMKGVQSVSADLAGKNATIKYNEEEVTPEALRDEVKELGFELLINE